MFIVKDQKTKIEIQVVKNIDISNFLRKALAIQHLLTEQ